MKNKPDPKTVADVIGKNMDAVLKELDKKVALTKEKHFVIIHCTDPEGGMNGTAYNFMFVKLSEPIFKKLDPRAQEAILNTRLNNDIGVVIIDPNNEVTVINYKRN